MCLIEFANPIIVIVRDGSNIFGMVSKKDARNDCAETHMPCEVV